MSFFLLIVFLLASGIGWIIIPQILFISFKKRLFDVVDSRKIHVGYISRLGGLFFLPTQFCLYMISICLVYYFNIIELKIGDFLCLLQQFLLVTCGLILLYAIGVRDDLIGVSYRWKIIIQLVAASLLPLSGLWINDLYGIFGISELSEIIGKPLTVIVVVVVINSVNMIDGIDGLCSGIIILGCLTLGLLFISQNAWFHALFAIITVGILLPFFYYNVFGVSKKGHRIFMGDTGSLTLGLSISFLVVSYSMNNPEIKPFSPDAIVVAFAVLFIPIFDIIRVIWIRVRLKKTIFIPDRNHLHHKFLRYGISTNRTMIIILGLALFYNLFNVLVVKYMDINFVLFVDFGIWIIFNMCFDKYGLLNFRKKLVNC